ncbi:3'-5' exonuclease family protein [Natronorubrum texcoconense]|uniref:RNase_H superfamily protein n=1 Tax=Natronorubrum texcoconense TaxID=1095776 RepID=A0A1G8V8Y2_9EURY|nr:hypothetical protein [Natronorubrum texcoconense]SDJ62429.1 hypothetical protein SAMN04515672_1223 [Natronorubrum texcoconense]
MGDLTPLAFDIETSGLEPGSVITVGGLAFDLGAWLVLNTSGRHADANRLETVLEDQTGSTVHVTVVDDERALLTALADCAAERVDGDRHYLTAFNGEVWKGGFDLPFLRTACVRHNVDWPFPDVAYADTMTMMDRFDTGDASDLEGVYEVLIGNDYCDPFADSGAAVDAFKNEDWVPLLLHNLADIQRTRELAVLAGRYIPKSDFKMKNLEPPNL